MRSPLTIIGICGWAIPPVWFQNQIASVFPNSTVQTFYPQYPADEAEAIGYVESHSADLWIGYSLGSLWLLKNSKLFPSTSQMALLSPILGFAFEMGQGGKTREVQLNYLARSLERSPDDLAPVFSFLKDIGIDTGKPGFGFNIETDTLIRGLNFLRDFSIKSQVLPSFHSILGKQDPLLEANVLMKILPGLNIVPDTGHQLAPLLESLAQSLPDINKPLT